MTPEFGARSDPNHHRGAPVTREDRSSLRELAARCRHLAKGVGSPETAMSLKVLADDYERQAAQAFAGQGPGEELRRLD